MEVRKSRSPEVQSLRWRVYRGVARVPEVGAVAFLPPGELQSLLRKEFRSSVIIFFGGRNATAPNFLRRRPGTA